MIIILPSSNFGLASIEEKFYYDKWLSWISGMQDEACIATLKKCEEAGIEEVILYFNFGHFSHQNTLKSMERFARDVMQHFSTE
jgi:hypothetical protein